MGNYNPQSIRVNVLSDGCYLILGDDNEPVIIPRINEHNDYYDWVLNMNDTELEAALQVYWDMWNFQSGDTEDKDALNVLEKERTRRKQTHSSFAPGTFR